MIQFLLTQIAKLKSKLGNVGNTDLQSQVNTLADSVANLKSIAKMNFASKTSQGSSTTLTFTVDGRSCGYIFISKLGANSSVYAFYSTSNSGNFEFSKICGSDVAITCTNDKEINVPATAWSTVSLMANSADIS